MSRLIYFCSVQYPELSNFYPCSIEYEGDTYSSVETAYQASKFPKAEREKFLSLSPKEARKFKKQAPPRSRREDYAVMRILLTKKFECGILRQYLENTRDATLVHWAPWDTFWGFSQQNGGKNILGRLLMNIREKNRNEGG